VSRSRVLELQALSDDNIRELLNRTLSSSRGLDHAVTVDSDALDALSITAGGDARVALTSLELAAQLAAHSDQPGTITLQLVQDVMPSRMLPYDKGGDMHYDVISAFIKSMRGSDPDAALYWMARMIHGGEDPKFIARRMLIFASEDVGNADPQALLIADAAFRAAEIIGMPECRINLAQAAVYLALAPKSNAAYVGIDKALAEVREGKARPVPSYLRDRTRPGSDQYGPYLYPHSYPNHWVDQDYLPEGLARGDFYTPDRIGWEDRALTRLDEIIDNQSGTPLP